MPKQRNVVTLSDVPPDVIALVNAECRRRHELGLPNWRFYQVFVEAVRRLMDQTRPGATVYYLKDGHGPFFTVHEALDGLGVPRDKRGLYWHRHDRLPKEYADQIIPTPYKGDGAQTPSERQEEPVNVG